MQEEVNFDILGAIVWWSVTSISKELVEPFNVNIEWLSLVPLDGFQFPLLGDSEGVRLEAMSDPCNDVGLVSVVYVSGSDLGRFLVVRGVHPCVGSHSFEPLGDGFRDLGAKAGRNDIRYAVGLLCSLNLLDPFSHIFWSPIELGVAPVNFVEFGYWRRNY